MVLLSLLLPGLLISLPQSISKISQIPSGIKLAVRHFRGSPTTPGDSASPVEGIPDINPDPSADNIIVEPFKPTYQPLLYTGKDAWTAFLEDPAGSWEKGEREHVWFFWFSGVDVPEGGEIGAPLVEETEWPAIAGAEDGEFELRRRKLEVGMFRGSHNDEVYRDTAIGIAKQQQQTEWEQEKEARLSASSASKNMEPTSVDQIIFSSDTPTVSPSSYAQFAFVNCNDEEEKSLCYRFLAIEEHRPMLYAVVRNVTIIEPRSPSTANAEPEVAPLVPEFVHMGENNPGLTKQSGDDPVIDIEIEEKDIAEDPVVEEVVETELPSPPQPTIIYKLLLRKVPLKANLTTTDLHNFYEFKHWEKLPVWDDPLNPADGLVGTAMEGKVGEFIGIGYEYWYKTPKWVFGMCLGLLLRWITVTIIDRSQQKREKKKAMRREEKAAELAATAVAEAQQIPLKTQAILPQVPKVAEFPVETQAPEEIEVVEHAELAKAEEVASIAEVLGGITSEKKENNPVVEQYGDESWIEANGQDEPVEDELVEDEPAEDEPVEDEPVEDEPAVESAEDQPVIETNGDMSDVNTDEDRPVVHTDGDTQVVHTDDDKSAVDTDDDTPIVHTNDDNSAVHIDDDTPVVQTNDDKLTVHTDDDKPSAHTNVDRPVIQIIEDRPVVDTNDESPVDPVNGDNFEVIENESDMDMNDEKPVNEANGSPVVEAKDDEPVMKVTAAAEVKEDEPAVETYEDKPVITTPEMKPVVSSSPVKQDVNLSPVKQEPSLSPMKQDAGSSPVKQDASISPVSTEQQPEDKNSTDGS